MWSVGFLSMMVNNEREIFLAVSIHSPGDDIRDQFIRVRPDRCSAITEGARPAPSFFRSVVGALTTDRHSESNAARDRHALALLPYVVRLQQLRAQ
jgi:hypothetical protein